MILRKYARKPVELPNGAKVVCRHCFLAILKTVQGPYVHVFNGHVRCRGEDTQRSKVIYVAEPYILP